MGYELINVKLREGEMIMAGMKTWCPKTLCKTIY